VFVLTDGLSTQRSLTKQKAIELKHVATKVISIGKSKLKSVYPKARVRTNVCIILRLISTRHI